MDRPLFPHAPTSALHQDFGYAHAVASSSSAHPFEGKRNTHLTDDRPEGNGQRKRRRKTYSCTNCHKLKAKCDRQVPCSGCVKRKNAEACSLLLRDRQEEGSGPDGGLRPVQNQRGHRSNIPPVTSQHLQQQLPYDASSDAHLRPILPRHALSDTRTSESRPDRTSKSQSDAHVNNGRDYSHSADDDSSDDERKPGFGTLILDEDGRSLFFGAHAGSDWLREPEQAAITPYLGGGKQSESLPAQVSVADQAIFPFSMPKLDALAAMTDILHSLPNREDVDQLTDCYYLYVSWNYEIVERPVFEAMVQRIYEAARLVKEEGLSSGRAPINPHELALFYVVLASGCQYNLDLAVSDPIANHYLLLSQRCLSMGSFMTKNTIAAVQALNIMGHYFLPTDQRGDSSWPIWGLSMRMIQAMGLHRDGSRWNLPDDVVDERRRVFWEAHTADVFQAACFSRPNSLQENQFDTKFPIDKMAPNSVDQGYSLLKFRLAQIALPILSIATSVTQPVYSKVQQLWQTVCDFERTIPFYMRCKPAWTAMVSINRNPDSTAPFAPEIRKQDFRLTLQQHNLALNCCEAVLSCQRSYFTRALCQNSKELSTSKYYSSFLAVFERCLGIVAITKSLHDTFPNVCYHNWNFFYDLHTAAVCFSTVVILRPTSFLAPFAMSELQTIAKLFSDAPVGSRPRQSLNSVLAIQKRAQERFDVQVPPPNNILSDMSAACGIPSVESTTSEADDERQQEHVAMLGWDTRLVRRLKAGAEADGFTIAKTPPDEQKRIDSDIKDPMAMIPSFWSPMDPLPSIPTLPAGPVTGQNSTPSAALGIDETGAGFADQDWDFWMDWFRACNPEGQ